jgi:hypothetical protein
MKRKDLLTHLFIAGYHNDPSKFINLIIDNRINKVLAEEQFQKGFKSKENGAKCGCSKCEEALS